MDSGTIVFADVDLSDGHTITAIGNPTIVTAGGNTPLAGGTIAATGLGTFVATVTTAATGGNAGTVTWTYTVADSAVDFLADGTDNCSDYTVEIDDGNGGTVSRDVEVTITGKNDAPTVSGAVDAGTTNEDAAASIIDLLANAADVDTSDDLDVAGVAATSSNAGRVVAFTVDNETGQFTLDPTQFNDLGIGESETVTVTYNVRGSRHWCVHCGNGYARRQWRGNDAPVIADPGATVTVLEDSSAVISGVSIADVDNADGVDEVTATLTVANGVVIFAALTGLTVTAGANNSRDRNGPRLAYGREHRADYVEL